MICSNPQLYRITTTPVPHQHRLLSLKQALSSTAIAWSMLPGEKLLTCQTTESSRERSVNHKSCKEKQLSPISCITTDNTEKGNHVHTTSLFLHISFAEPGPSHIIIIIIIILLVFPLSLSMLPKLWLKLENLGRFFHQMAHQISSPLRLFDSTCFPLSFTP